jgi:hypothetical protein
LRIGSETKWYPARRARWASSRPNGYAPIASAPCRSHRRHADRIGAIEKIVGEFAGKR